MNLFPKVLSSLESTVSGPILYVKDDCDLGKADNSSYHLTNPVGLLRIGKM